MIQEQILVAILLGFQLFLGKFHLDLIGSDSTDHDY
jgi:hypothetical protein